MVSPYFILHLCKIQVLTRLDSLFKEPEESTTWLVDRLLPSGGFSALVAKPKVGKTTGAENLALHIASGKQFLGRDVNQGVVIYLALGEKRSEVKNIFKIWGQTVTRKSTFIPGELLPMPLNKSGTPLNRLNLHF